MIMETSTYQSFPRYDPAPTRRKHAVARSVSNTRGREISGVMHPWGREQR